MTFWGYELLHANDGVLPVVDKVLNLIVDSGMTYAEAETVLEGVGLKLKAGTKPVKAEATSN